MRRDLLVLDQMITAAARATAICRRHSLADLEERQDAREALLWNMTVLGEAATQLSPDLREAHSEIPWRNAIALRNRIVHGYWSVDIQIIHTAAIQDLPEFHDQLVSLLADLETS